MENSNSIRLSPPQLPPITQMESEETGFLRLESVRVRGFFFKDLQADPDVDRYKLRLMASGVRLIDKHGKMAIDVAVRDLSRRLPTIKIADLNAWIAESLEVVRPSSITTSGVHFNDQIAVSTDAVAIEDGVFKASVSLTWIGQANFGAKEPYTVRLDSRLIVDQLIVISGGCYLKKIKRLLLPLSRPNTVDLGLQAFLRSWSDFPMLERELSTPFIHSTTLILPRETSQCDDSVLRAETAVPRLAPGSTVDCLMRGTWPAGELGERMFLSAFRDEVSLAKFEGQDLIGKPLRALFRLVKANVGNSEATVRLSVWPELATSAFGSYEARVCNAILATFIVARSDG